MNRGHWDEAILQNTVNAGTLGTGPEFFFDGDFLIGFTITRIYSF